MSWNWIVRDKQLPSPDTEVLWAYETGEYVLCARGEDDMSDHEPAITHWILPVPPNTCEYATE
jgi:hypothetical protein